MDSSSSGRGGVPPGFRFHPTDEELLHFYLKKKVSFQKFDMEVIREVDLNKIEPWDLFSHKDRKYPTGSRTNRATSAGFSEAPLSMNTNTTASLTSCNLQSRSLFTDSDLMMISMNQYNVQQQEEFELGSDPNYTLAVPVSASLPQVHCMHPSLLERCNQSSRQAAAATNLFVCIGLLNPINEGYGIRLFIGLHDTKQKHAKKVTDSLM